MSKFYPASKREGYIYFIACEPLRAVKIGFTRKSPYARLQDLQTGSASPLKMLCFVPGSCDEEKRLHQVFAQLGIHREWFRLEWALAHFVAYLRGQTPDEHEVPRQLFLDALHDCVMQGSGWHPDLPISDDEYYATADWEPFRKELWDAFGPWEE